MEMSTNVPFSTKENMSTLLLQYSHKKKDLADNLFWKDDKFSKLSNGTFFEFMKTAYQVNDSLSSSNLPSTGYGVNWNKLTEINLNPVSVFPPYNDKGGLHVESTHQGSRMPSDISSEICGSKRAEMTKKRIDPPISTFSCPQEIVNNRDEIIYVPGKMNCLQNNPSNEIQSDEVTNTQDSKNITGSPQSVSTADSALMTFMKRNLSDILHEGLLDSVLPYMVPEVTVSQPIIKKPIPSMDIKKCTSISTAIEGKLAANFATYKEKAKESEKNKFSKKSQDTEVEIHVFDEDKNVKKNFRCPQKLLVQKMCYFADVTAGQKLEEIDISVHCDVVIFDWLMRWVKKDIIKKSEWPVLEASNVIPIMVSACFLQMEPLLENCLVYCHANMSEVLKTSSILTCLDDNILTSLAEKFSNEEVESLKDKRDKIQSKLFCKLIVFLSNVTCDNKKGHYSSLATLFRCSKCGKKIIQSTSSHVPCIATAIKIDKYGKIQSSHARDLSWTLDDYIISLRTELRSWRKVYWRLWGDCHFLFCQQCNIYFPIHQLEWCCYHPELPQFFINEQQRPVPYPLGRYPCCSQRAYRFEALPNLDGCRHKEHLPEIKTQRDINILNIFMTHKEVIATEPPKLFFPEKITRLVARDPSVHPHKLICKDTMWWSGIELSPPRPRLGLLGKIWNGLEMKHPDQESRKYAHKLRRQFSSTTQVSSTASSTTDSDDGDKKNTYDESSADEESSFSDESNIWAGREPFTKTKRSKNYFMRKFGGGCWNSDLNVRHNQDNQRDFEERAAFQMIMLLTKRMSVEPSSLPKSSSKQMWKKSQPAGGTYAKLEAEFREQMFQSYKCKNLTGKNFLRPKSTKQ